MRKEYKVIMETRDSKLVLEISVIAAAGSGKTSLLKLIRHLVPNKRPYEVIPACNIVFYFNNLDYRTIGDYGSSQFSV